VVRLEGPTAAQSPGGVPRFRISRWKIAVRCSGQGDQAAGWRTSRLWHVWEFATSVARGVIVRTIERMQRCFVSTGSVSCDDRRNLLRGAQVPSSEVAAARSIALSWRCGPFESSPLSSARRPCLAGQQADRTSPCPSVSPTTCTTHHAARDRYCRPGRAAPDRR